MLGDEEEVASLERTIKEITKKYGEVCEQLGSSRQRCDAFERFVSFVAHEYTVLISTILRTAEAELKAMAGRAARTFEVHYGSSEDCRDLYAVMDVEERTVRVFYVTNGCQTEISVLPPAHFGHYAEALEIAADAFNDMRLSGEERFSLGAFADGRDVLSTSALDIAGTMFDAYIQVRTANPPRVSRIRRALCDSARSRPTRPSVSRDSRSIRRSA